jgi:hypothetical protein
MSGILEAPPWAVVGELIDQNQRNFLERRGSLVQDFDAWFRAVDLFRQTEEERLILQEPTSEDLRQHRTWLTGLIAEGERLITEAPARGGLAGHGGNFTVADAEATLEILYLSQREWHGPRLSEIRRQQILKAVFNVSESAA